MKHDTYAHTYTHTYSYDKSHVVKLSQKKNVKIKKIHLLPSLWAVRWIVAVEQHEM